jgi:hypothetical protein
MFITGFLLRSRRAPASPRSGAEQKGDPGKRLLRSQGGGIWMKPVTLKDRLLTLSVKRVI